MIHFDQLWKSESHGEDQKIPAKTKCVSATPLDANFNYALTLQLRFTPEVILPSGWFQAG